MTGWECPKCGYVYAPFVTQCARCNVPTIVTLPSTAPCTCGTSIRCPVHQPDVFLQPTTWSGGTS